MNVSTVTFKGQVTIPVDIRRMLDLKPGKKVNFYVNKGVAEIRPAVNFLELKGSFKSKKPFNIKAMRKAAALYLGKRHGKTD